MSSPSSTGAPPSRDIVQVGSYFLETLTTGMYENPFHCIREYIQNGFDAIHDAIRANQLSEGDGRILISLGGTPRNPSLSIRDNGIGIVSGKAFATLISLGSSRKTPSLHAGFRGIGRLAGIAYCTTLRFTTSAAGEAVATVVEFDCGRIRSYFSPGAEPVDVRDVVISSVRTQTIEANPADHFTEVEMTHLVDQGLEFVEVELLQPYLRQVSPVDYPDTFEFADKIRALADTFGEKLGIIHVEIKQKRERTAILKPYKSIYPTGRKNSWSKIHDIEVLISREHGWFGWIGISNFPGEIADDTAAGVRFRLKNIGIGDSDIIESIAAELTPSGTERRLQRWAIGEIFVTNTQVVPNARRDGFEDNKAWRIMRQDLQERVVKRVIRLARDESKTRNLIKAIAEEAAKYERIAKAAELDPLIKAMHEREIRKHLTALGSTTKLVGADPKEVSALTTRFKDVIELLSKIPVPVRTEPPAQNGSDGGAANKGDNGSGAGGPANSTPSQSTGGAGNVPSPPNSAPPPAPTTRESVIKDVLLTALDAPTAERLTARIIASLTAAGL